MHKQRQAAWILVGSGGHPVSISLKSEQGAWEAAEAAMQEEKSYIEKLEAELKALKEAVRWLDLRTSGQWGEGGVVMDFCATASMEKQYGDFGERYVGILLKALGEK